ncbi:flagellin [Opitutus sp. ER46]|uniref:flagellin n=1 Tax=Opitutus sp. ER46 TaxID=2161864 RepID=UPI000D2F9254|nr:flagellin [Opitutus sp. ER46]PTX90875.1 flagellin [Opitutus sp. ER46]
MSVVINTNTAATIASNNLASSSASLQRSLNRLSSGSKIVNPSDDAGGLAVSMKLSAAAKRSAAANSNIGNVTSYLQTQDGVLQTSSKVMDRISELWTMYQDPTKNSSDKANYDAEYQQLQKELDSLTQEKFNGVSLFGSAGTGVVESVKVSEDGVQTVAITAKALASSTDGVGAFSDAAGGGSLSSISSIDSIKTGIQNVATFRAKNGAEQSRLGFAAEVLTTNKANLESANSRIVDVDVAAESTQLARWNILVQSGTAMLSQANQSAQSALSLIR